MVLPSMQMAFSGENLAYATPYADGSSATATAGAGRRMPRRVAGRQRD